MSGRAVVLLLLVVNGLGLFALERRGRSDPTRPSGRRRHIRANLMLTALLVVLNLVLDGLVAASGVARRGPDAGAVHRAGLPVWADVVLVVLVLDWLAYVAHVLLHKLAPAWRFHRVHHSDAEVDVTTAFRQHPLETVWRYSFLLLGALALDAPPTSVAVYLAASALNAQLEHADISLPWRLDRLMRAVFASPAMHRVHHSRAQEETDTNYSNIFSFWDRMFGTYRVPRAGERIACGLDDGGRTG